VAASLKMPVFVAQGGRDYQVTMQDFKGWKRGLRRRPNAVFRLYPLLNHLLVAGRGKSSPQEYEKAGHVHGKLIVDVARWIKR